MRNNRLLRILLWPYRPGYPQVPWFVVVWRVPFWVLFQVGRLLSTVSVFAGFGRREAEQFWRDSQ